MSRKFAQIEVGFWRSKKLVGASIEAKLLALYILSSPHRNSAGIFYMPMAYIQADLGWTEKQVRIQVSELARRRFIEFDERVSILAVVGWFGHNPIDNRKHAQAVIDQFCEAKCESQVYLAHVERFVRYAEQSGKEYLSGLDTERLTASDTGIETGTDSGFLTRDTDTDTETETLGARMRARETAASELREAFEEFWSEYPRKDDRKDAEAAYKGARKHTDRATILEGLRRSRTRWEREGREERFIPYAGKWLRHDGWTVTESGPPPRGGGGPPRPGDAARFAEAAAKRKLAEQGVSEFEDGYGRKLADLTREIIDGRHGPSARAA